MNVLKEESEIAINWLSSNKMIVNLDKFKSVILTKNKSDDIATGFSIGTDIVSTEKSVKLLRIHLNNRLNFNLDNQIKFNCISTAEEIVKFWTKKVLVYSFILSNFDHCPLLWFISSVESLKKVEIYKNVTFNFYRKTITALMKHCYTNLEKKLELLKRMVPGLWVKSGLRCTLLPKVCGILGNGNRVWE